MFQASSFKFQVSSLNIPYSAHFLSPLAQALSGLNQLLIRQPQTKATLSFLLILVTATPSAFTVLIVYLSSSLADYILNQIYCFACRRIVNLRVTKSLIWLTYGLLRRQIESNKMMFFMNSLALLDDVKRSVSPRQP